MRSELSATMIGRTIGVNSAVIGDAGMGNVLSVGDGIARVSGVDRPMAGEMLEFFHGVEPSTAAAA